MNHSIKGMMVSPDLKKENEILILTTNKSHVELVLSAIGLSKFKYILYCQNFDFAEYVNDYKNVKFVTDYENLLTIMFNVEKVITLVGQLIRTLPIEFIKILYLSAKLKKTIIEFPHGFFQTGYNLYDSSKLIKFDSHNFGGGGIIQSIACVQYTWFGNDGVGYPIRSLANKEKKIVPRYTILTTNTNWYLYSVEDKRSFFNIVFNYISIHPNRLFIWTPHPAEMVEPAYARFLELTKPNNLLIYGMSKDIYFHGIDNTEDVIRYAQDGIATVGTSLLDFEYHSIPVHVFDCFGVSELLSSFVHASKFSSLTELDKTPDKIKTSYLKEFDTVLFDKLIMEASYREDNERLYMLQAFCEK